MLKLLTFLRQIKKWKETRLSRYFLVTLKNLSITRVKSKWVRRFVACNDLFHNSVRGDDYFFGLLTPLTFSRYSVFGIAPIGPTCNFFNTTLLHRAGGLALTMTRLHGHGRQDPKTTKKRFAVDGLSVLEFITSTRGVLHNKRRTLTFVI